MADPNTLANNVREKARKEANRRLERQKVADTELEEAILDWDLTDYESFFTDCRNADKTTERCGAIWNLLKERGDAPTGGGAAGEQDGGAGSSGGLPATPSPRTVEELESEFRDAEAVYLITTTGCPDCQAAKEALADWIDDGLLEVLNVQESDKAADIVINTGLEAVPSLVMEEDGEFTAI